MLGGYGTQTVTGLASTALAVTRDAVGPIEVIGAYDTDGMPAVVAAWRPTDPGAPQRLEPRSGVHLDATLDISSIGVPRFLTIGLDGFRHIPIALTLLNPSAGQEALQSAEIATDPSLQPQSALALGPRSAFATSCSTNERAAYIGSVGLFLDLQGGAFAAHGVSGSPSTMFGIPPANTWPGFGNSADGDLVAVEEVNSVPVLFCQTGVTSVPVSCGTLAAPLGEIDLAADALYTHDAWFVGGTGRECAGNAAPVTPTMVVGDTHDAGMLATLNTSMMSHCSHPRISPVPGESLSQPQHAVVVASCLTFAELGTDQVSQVFAWVVERPAVPDAGTDAGDDVVDASADAVQTTDGAVDGSTSMDAGTTEDVQSVGNGSGPSFRGSGCGCRSTGSTGSRVPGGAVLIALGAALARRRRRGDPI